MAFQTELKPRLERAIERNGVILELSTAFKMMQSDSVFSEILAMSNELSDLDIRAQFNYSLLLFSTGKVYHYIIMLLLQPHDCLNLFAIINNLSTCLSFSSSKILSE